MRKFILASCTIAFSSLAVANHGPAGCGLGSILFEGKKGLAFNVLAAIVNGTSGNQTFGMSTGTLGCEDAKSATVAAIPFIEGNKVALANDIARGEGETLDAYLTIIRKTDADKNLLKKNFAAIFAEGDNAQAIYLAINQII